ncbi:MAG: histidine kinase [Bacteroidia bacterium]|nr:histidine kinase [Bacteroidia bacterium]
MKKVTGCGLQVAGCGLQVAGCRLSGIRRQMRGAESWGIGMLLICSIISFTATGQNLKYAFKKGQILDYDYSISNRAPFPDEGPSAKLVYKHRFTVDSVANGTFWLTFYLKGVYSGGIWISGNEQVLDSNVSWARNAVVLNKIYAFQTDHPVRFMMDETGHILDMPGMDSLLPALHHLANDHPEIRELYYPTYKAMFSSDYYALIIHEFFPVLPSLASDTISLVSGDKKISTITLWNPDFAGTADTSDIRLKRTYEFRKKDLIYTDPLMSIPTRINPMNMNWNHVLGRPVAIQYDGIPPVNLVQELTIKYGSLNFGLYTVTINRSTLEEVSSAKVVIRGSFQNPGENKIMVALPGRKIMDPLMPVTLNPDGSFSLEHQLEIPAGIASIYYTKPGAYLWVSPVNPNQVKLFVRPGDTVILRMDLANPSSLQFECQYKHDQVLLNELSKDCPPADPNRSIRTTHENIRKINEDRLKLSQEFVRFMEFENRYTLLSHEVEVFSRYPLAKNGQNPMEILRRFVWELNNPDGYKSMAYKEFISDLLQAYRDIQILKIFGYSEDRKVDLATAVLTGWDLYWYLAHSVDRQLGTFPARNYDFLYKRFCESYPGTDFQAELTKKYKQTENGRIGASVPDMKFIEYGGKKSSIKELYGRNWCLFNLYTYREINEFVSNWVSKFQMEYTGQFTFVLSTHQCSRQEIDSLAKKCQGKPMILILNPGKDLVTYLESLPPMVIYVDRDGKIAYHGQLWAPRIPSYLRWTEQARVQTKTINLTVFWYSLAGAFVLSLFIILSIRFRAKRREARLNLKRRMAQLEVDAVRSRMNPHFLFNALSSIQNLINKKQIEEANLFLARFGELVRTILNQSSKPAIGLNEEIDMIRNYLQLEQLRFPFQFNIQIDPSLDIFAIEVPPLLIQPHVENAVMHGISALGNEGRIDVIFRAENRHLICEVKDNGPGYHPGIKNGNGGLGQGWKLTRQRIELMKEQYGDDVSVEVRSPSPETGDNGDSSGTTVIFSLPMQQPD